MPTADGTSATAQAGSIEFVDRNGKLLRSLANPGLSSGRGEWRSASLVTALGSFSLERVERDGGADEPDL